MKNKSKSQVKRIRKTISIKKEVLKKLEQIKEELNTENDSYAIALTILEYKIKNNTIE